MSAKKPKQKKSPPLRSKNGTRRDKFIQFRVSITEKKHAQKAFGKQLGRAIRAFLCGQVDPEPCIMDDQDRRFLMQALHAHYMINERIHSYLGRGDRDAAMQLRSEQNETFKHLAKICFTNFSK